MHVVFLIITQNLRRGMDCNFVFSYFILLEIDFCLEIIGYISNCFQDIYFKTIFETVCGGKGD